MKLRLYANRLLPKVLLQILPITIFVLLAIDYFGSQLVTQTVVDQHRARLDRIAVQSSISIGRVLQNVVDTADNLADNDLIINSLIDASARDRYIPVLFQSLQVPGTTKARITLTDYRGRKIASNTGAPDYTSAAWLDAVMTGERYRVIGDTGMLVAAPVYVSKFAEGMIIVELDKASLSELVKLPIETDAFALKTSAGAQLYASKDFPQPQGVDDKLGSLASGWIGTQTNVRGFPTVQLHVVDRVETVLAVVQRMDPFMLFAVLLSVGAVTIGIVVTALLVSKPLRIFSRGVERIQGSSDLAYRMEVFGPEEFRRLTRSFNVMLTKLERTTSSRDYVDGILNSMGELMLVIDDKGTIQSANLAAAKFLDRDISSVSGLHISQLLAGQSQGLAKLLAAGQAPREMWLKNQTGTEIPVTVSTSTLEQGKTGSGRTILVLNDITEEMNVKAALERNIEDLERSNADLEQFAYSASHDLKAPLRAIDSLARMVEEDDQTMLSADSRTHLSLMRGRCGRLRLLLEGILDYARSGRSDADVRLVDSGAMVREIVDLLSPRPGLKIDVSDDLPTFMANRLPLQQVFQNLIGNAIKHHDLKEGRIGISCRDLGSHFEFEVSDDGPGISESYHERIFQMFQTLKRRDEVEGTGMGLALVEKLIRANGGEVVVISPAEDRGAVFRFTWRKHETAEDKKHAA